MLAISGLISPERCFRLAGVAGYRHYDPLHPYRQYRGRVFRPAPFSRARRFESMVDFLILAITISSFLFLTFYVFDTTRLLTFLIMEALDKKPVWNITSQNQFLGQTGLPGEELDYWMLIRLIARRTEVVSKLIYYPFNIWFILFVSRWSNFENWHAPIGLVYRHLPERRLHLELRFHAPAGGGKLRTQVIDRLSRNFIGLCRHCS